MMTYYQSNGCWVRFVTFLNIRILIHVKWWLTIEVTVGFMRHCISVNCVLTHLLVFSATNEAGDDPEVVRAKYFIRDEFLVSLALY
jgi:hypothetical protein